jgi:N-acetyl-beta-hexosaminidase
MVDRDLLLRKASDLEQYLGQLAEYRMNVLQHHLQDLTVFLHAILRVA